MNQLLTSNSNNKAANVVLYDQSDGLFSDLLDGSTVVAQSVSLAAGQQSSVLRSIRYGYPENHSPSTDIPVKFYNYSSSFIVLRWLDQDGNAPQSHTWTLAPNEIFDQRTIAGHIFLLSVVLEGSGQEDDLFGSSSESNNEAVLGAFRPKRSLPSGSYHSVQVHDGDVARSEASNNNNTSDVGNSYILEVVLADETCYDALVIASYWLDHEIICKQTRQGVVKTLQRIVSNVIKDPTNDKYRRLRLSNGTISKHIGGHWSAMEFLRVLGFGKKNMAINHQKAVDESTNNDAEESEDYLVAESVPDDAKLSLYANGITLLEQLQSRCQPNFVADLAPPTPWDGPVLLDGSNTVGGGRGGGGGRWGNAGSTHFITPDDRWARVERARQFRGRAGPRPTPGNAPSDRGRWGR